MTQRAIKFGKPHITQAAQRLHVTDTTRYDRQGASPRGCTRKKACRSLSDEPRELRPCRCTTEEER